MLSSFGLKNHMLRINPWSCRQYKAILFILPIYPAYVKLILLRLPRLGTFCPITLNLKFQHHSILIRRRILIWFIRIAIWIFALSIELKPFETSGVAGKGHKTKTCREDFILDYGGVVLYEDVLDG